jgi:hypothetical protein
MDESEICNIKFIRYNKQKTNALLAHEMDRAEQIILFEE